MVLISGAIDARCLKTSSNIATTVPLSWLHFSKSCTKVTITGADPGEVKWANFHPPPPQPFFSEPPSFFLFLITSTRLWFFYIITKIHPPFQNPGSGPALFSPWHLQLLRSLSLVTTCVLWLNRHLEYGVTWNDSSVLSQGPEEFRVNK